MKINKNVFWMGITSLLTDVSSEMIYPILPIFLSSVLGVNKAFIGLIEGIAESTASLLKVFSGYISDYFQKRKPLVVFGYSLSTTAKPFLSIAGFGWQVLFLRFLDRVGKGIRTSPRDAIIADSVTAESRGLAFGFHRSMDTLGAIIGPLLTFLLLPLFHGSYRIIFLLSAIPAVLAVIFLAWKVEEKKTETLTAEKIKFKLSGFPREFYMFIFIVTLFTLGNSSDAFLILRAQDVGVAVFLIPIVWLLFNTIYSLSSVPSGILSDMIGRKKVMLFGFTIYALVYFGFARASSSWQIWFLFACYGLFYGFTDGIFRAHIADLVDSRVRATAYGVYYTFVGLAAFPASVIMGVLWQSFGPAAAFNFGASLAGAAAILMVLFLR